MPTHLPLSVRRPRRIVVFAVAAVIGLVAATAWWLSHPDERRADAACGTYLQQRGLLRAALGETDEATGRAVAANAGRVEDRYFNDADEVQSRIDQWLHESPGVIDSLDHGKDAELDRGAIQALTFVEQGFLELQSLIENSEPSEVADWLPEVGARVRGVDDTCLWVARSTSP